MAFKTKPRGEQLSFLTECHRCRADLTISNGRVDRHDCEPRNYMGAFQDALGDYYDSGAIGKPPTLADIKAALDRQEHR
jgi:hypothetical protein